MRRSTLIGIGVAGLVLIAVMATTGPRPVTETTEVIRRTGGPCLQLEQWGLFGWVIVGQTQSVEDIESGNWHTPPSSNPPCEEATSATEYLVQMPTDAGPDVYRLCGLTDENGCLEFTLVSAEAAAEP